MAGPNISIPQTAIKAGQDCRVDHTRRDDTFREQTETGSTMHRGCGGLRLPCKQEDNGTVLHARSIPKDI